MLRSSVHPSQPQAGNAGTKNSYTRAQQLLRRTTVWQQ